MLTYGALLFDAKRILGTCEAEYLSRRINEAVELLANKGDFDPYIGVVDIAAEGTSVPLPPEVETVLAVNNMGIPGRGLDRMFNFHLDGPGDLPRQSFTRWRWKDEGESPVFANPSTATTKLWVQGLTADLGKQVTIYGTDSSGNPLGEVVAGSFVPGLHLTVQATGVTLSSVFVNRIDRVTKPDTTGALTLFAVDTETNESETLAVYRGNWQEPMFRLITIETASPWVRVLFRRKVQPLARDTDLIPLHSSRAVIAMLQSLKYYDDGEIASAQAYEATALRWLEEEQKSRRANLYMPPQVDIDTSLMPAHEQMY